MKKLLYIILNNIIYYYKKIKIIFSKYNYNYEKGLKSVY